MKIKKIIKEGRFLNLYVRKAFFVNWEDEINFYNNRFNDGNETFLGCGIDETGKYIILTFILRSKEEILKYARNM